MKNKFVNALLALTAVILMSPPLLHASEIDINLESHGRLEYNLDEQGNPDVIIADKDLTTLSDTITQYNLNMKQKFKESFESLGVGLKDDGSPQLGTFAKTSENYNMSQYLAGLVNIPRSYLKNGSNITLTDSNSANVALVAAKVYTTPVKYTFTIPKGWRNQQTVVDATDIYTKAAELWTEQTFRDKHTKYTHHIHSNTSTSATGTSTTGNTADCSPGGIPDGDKAVGNGQGVTTKGGCFNGTFLHYHDNAAHAYNAPETKDTAGTPGWAKSTTLRSGTNDGCFTVRHNHSCSDTPHVNAPCTPAHVGGSGECSERNDCHTVDHPTTHEEDDCNGATSHSHWNSYTNSLDTFTGVCSKCGGGCPFCGGGSCKKTVTDHHWVLTCTKTCHRSGSEADYYTLSCTKTAGSTVMGWYQTCSKSNRQVLSCLVTY